MKGRAPLWATAISVSALTPHAAPVALGLMVAKECFDLLHARMLRTSVLSYIRATAAGTYLSVDRSGAAPRLVLHSESALAGSRGDQEGAVPVPADGEPSQSGSDLDLDDFCVKHHADWLSHAGYYTRNFQDAQDAVSHVVEKIVMHHAREGTLCPPKYDDPVAWAKKAILNYIRDRHRRTRVQLKYRAKLCPPPGDFEEDLLDGMLATQAFAFIKDLKPGDHEIAVMHFIDELEPIEIARRLGRKPSTVRTSLHRTREKMRRQLGITDITSRSIPRETT
jgi:RNA polymerase sigma factor (sigma-70 family)